MCYYQVKDMMLYVAHKKIKIDMNKKKKSKDQRSTRNERKAKEKENESTIVPDEYGKLPELSAMTSEINRLPFPDSDLSGNEMDDDSNGNNKGVRPSVIQSGAVVHGNGHGLVPGLDHLPSRSDDTSEAGGTSRMSHAMYKEAQEKWKNEQNGNFEKHYGIRIDNVPSQSNATMKLENNNTVIPNRDKTDGPELESPSATPAARIVDAPSASATASASNNNNNNGRGGVASFGANVVDNEDTDENEEDEKQQKKAKEKKKREKRKQKENSGKNEYHCYLVKK